MSGNGRRGFAAVLLSLSILLAAGAGALLGACGPFTDAAADAFCPFVLEILYLGITTGTTATTYDPASNVSRLQMAAFLSRTVDGALKRGSRRASLDQFWTSQNATVLGLTTIGGGPRNIRSDGADLWAANFIDNTVSRVRGSDGKVLETWTGATGSSRIRAAAGAVFVTGETNPGRLYRIDPAQSAGAVTTVASNLGNGPLGIAFDGARFWTANRTGGSVSIVTPAASIPWTVTTVAVGSAPYGALFDGTSVWITDINVGHLLKMDPGGAVLQTVTVGAMPADPIFDGSSIWIPNSLSGTVTVVRASTGAVLATLTGNGLGSNGPNDAAFDGQRILVTNYTLDSVSLWKADDLTPLGTFSTGAGTTPYGACSDGVNFWVTLNNTGRLARF